MLAKRLSIFAVFAAFMVGAIAVPAHVSAIDLLDNACQGVNDSSVCDSSEDELGDLIANVINVIFYFVGVTAIIAIIVGGFRYMTANGDAKAVSAAKNTVLYAVVGLVIALASFGIVEFVLNSF